MPAGWFMEDFNRWFNQTEQCNHKSCYELRIDIIGAGIGGVTTAIALEQNDFQYRIFEQTKAIKPVGAGIILANNAMQIFQKLGLRNQIELSGNIVSSLNITDAQLNKLSRVNLEFFEKKHGVKNVAIHRGNLLEILIKSLSEEHIFLDHKLEEIEMVNEEFHLDFKNRSSVISKYLLGADGINSLVRNSLFNESTIRDARQICWRGVTAFILPESYQNELNEAWGKGDRFGFVQIAPNKVYWYALKSFQHSPNEYPIEGLNDYFKTYHPMIKEIIESTLPNSIHTSVISDLKPIKKWYKQHVCLMGDAAHATTPNMGQGACQAIEDAFVIAKCLKKHKAEEAFREYQRLRIPKARQVVDTSWKIGKLAHWKKPLAIAFRNQLMKMTPDTMSRKQSERIFELDKA